MGGDFNDLREHEEKIGGKKRLDSSFNMFNSFINDMEMAKISSVGNVYTWANNREGEGFVETLDRFFGATRWLTKYPRAQALNVEKQTSVHSLLGLITEPAVAQKAFLF